MNALMDFAGGTNDAVACVSGAVVTVIVIFVCWAMHYSE